MAFQSATSNIQVSEETVIKTEDIPVGMIPVFGLDKKMKSSGVDVNSILSQEQSIINALIFS